MVGDAAAHHGARSDDHIVADGDAAEDRGSGVDAHVVADGGPPSLRVVAQGDELQAVEVVAYALGVEVGGVVVLEVAALSDVRAPDVQCPFWRQHPLDEHRNVLAHAVIEEVAEDSLARGHLDEGAQSAPVGRVFLEVGVYLSAFQQVEADVWQHAHGGCREDDCLRVWVHSLNCFCTMACWYTST